MYFTVNIVNRLEVPMLSFRTFPTSTSIHLLLLLFIDINMLSGATTTTQVAAYTLLTFDVDGTLVHSSSANDQPSAHSRAFSHAVGSLLSPENQCVIIPPIHQVLLREEVSGSTDGLILLRLARATLGVEPSTSLNQLDSLMDSMYDYVRALPDDQVALGMEPLPGVIETLQHLAKRQQQHGTNILCGLVTGNVEGVARIKMRATGIWATGALSTATAEQIQRYPESSDWAFLGGFGSDYCSGEIDSPERNYWDRAEQLSLAARRCRTMLPPNAVLRRVVHVGDAPADVLAAKVYAQHLKDDPQLHVSMVATATGKYSPEELRHHAGDNIPGTFDCFVLPDGLANPQEFLAACGVA